MKKFILPEAERSLINDILRINDVVSIKGIKDLVKKEGTNYVLKKKVNRKEFDRFCVHFLQEKNTEILKIMGYLDELPLEAIEYLHSLKKKTDKNYDCYLINQKFCPEKILKNIVDEDIFVFTDRALSRIKDFNFLMKYCGPDSNARFRRAVLDNPHCTEKHFQEIVNQIEDSIFITENIINHKFATPEIYHKIMLKSQYAASEIASKEDILPETIQYIIDYVSERSENMTFAKGALLLNPEVDIQFKQEILQKGVYRCLYNENDDLETVITSLSA